MPTSARPDQSRRVRPRVLAPSADRAGAHSAGIRGACTFAPTAPADPVWHSEPMVDRTEELMPSARKAKVGFSVSGVAAVSAGGASVALGDLLS